MLPKSFARKDGYERVMLAADAGFWDWDVEKDEFHVSPRLLELCGLPPGTVISGREDFVRRNSIHPEDKDRYEGAVARLFAGSDSRLSTDVRVVIDGETQWRHIAGICFRDARGRVVRWTGSSTDITERKRAEEQLRESQERYALAMEVADEGHFDWSVQTDEIFASARALSVLGAPPHRIRSKGLAAVRFHPDDERRIWAEWRAALAGQGTDHEFEYRVLRGEPPEPRWIRGRWKVFRDAAGTAQRVVGVVADITERKRAEALLSGEKHILESLAKGVPLRQVLDDLCRFVEELAPGVLASVQLLEGNRLRHGGAPSLPGAYTDAIDGEVIGPSAGSCGTAAYRGQQVIVSDIATDALWADYRALALPHGLRACWSTPVFSPEGKVIATFAMYYREPRSPSVQDRQIIEQVGHLAGVAIQHKLAADELRESEARFRGLTELWSDWYWRQDESLRFTFSSAATDPPAGYPGGVALGKTRWELPGVVPLSSSWAEHRELLAARKPFRDFEYSRPAAGGTLRYVSTSGTPVFDEKGEFRGYQGVARDITPRKLAEAALLESEGRFQRAILAADAGFWEWDAVKDEAYASPRLLEILGLPLDTKLAGREDFIHRMPFYPEDHDKWLRAVRDLFASGGSRLAMDLRYPRDGKTAWARLDGLCFRDETGRVVRWTGSVTEISERKRAQEALRLSEERYAVAMDVAEEGHLVWDVVADQFFVSEQAKRVLNVPLGVPFRTREEVMQHVPFYPDDLPRVAEAWQASLDGQEDDLDLQYRIMRGEEKRWIRARWKNFRDAGGSVQRVVGVVRDITERKLAEEALRESEERYALALAASEEGHFDHRIDSDKLFVSERLIEIFGFEPGTRFKSRDEWMQRFRFYGNDAETYQAALRAALAPDAPERYAFEYRILRPSGEMRWLRTRGSVTRDAQRRAIRRVGVVADITEARLAEEALRLSQERYAFAMEAAQDAHWDWIVGTDKYYTSTRVVDLLGFPPGTTFTSLEDYLARAPLLKEDLDVWQRKVRELFAGTGSRLSMDLRAIINGEVRWIQHHGLCVRDASGRAVRWCGTVRDTTEQRRAEEALRQAQRLESLGTMAGGIAHDFNNILGAILGFGEMAQRGAKKGSRLRRDLDCIMSAGERGRTLVDRILAFSRSGVGERVPVHVEEVVREALDQLAAKLPGNVTIAPQLRAHRAAMLGDSTQVHQVVMNLANNAAQAMPDGGAVRVTLEALQLEATRSATVGTVTHGDYIVLQVSDGGTGIAPEVLERMFDPFFTTKEIGVGSGLGLSLVHGIVANVGGAIDVATEVGKGSTFTVYLPRSGDAPAANNPPDDSRPLPRGEGERVLVVDDEEPLVRLATETLEGLGYAPVPFTSSAAALAAFRADPQRFDAVLTDERMPGLTGTALIREVRGIRGAIPVVLMSGVLGMEAPAASVVVRKPVSAGELAASLARALHP